MKRLVGHARRPELPLWRRWFTLIIGLIILILAPVICYAQGTPGEVTLSWTAPGDDGMIGTATNYEMRWSAAPISLANWAQATVVSGLPTPQIAGTHQSVTVTGLTQGTTYYFAIRSVDDNGNWSGLSNVLRWDWVFDTSPPAAPTGVAAANEGANVRVTWAPNSESDLSGYLVYRAESVSGGRTRISSSLVSGTQFLDTTVPAVSNVWYEVSAVDESGNESAHSSAYQLTLGSTSTFAWALETGYPNPSSLLSPVTLPITVPPGGAAGATIEIIDSGGHRIRLIDLSSVPSGAQTVVWDGRNESGRVVAPGVYRAWLIVGKIRQSVRLARVP